MQAHRLKTRVTEEHEIHVSVPDVPAGQEVEVIVLAEAPMYVSEFEPIAGDPRETLGRRFPQVSSLGPVVFKEDPCAPLSEEDWPEDLRP